MSHSQPGLARDHVILCDLELATLRSPRGLLQAR